VPYILGAQGAGPLDEVDGALVEQLAAGAQSVAARDGGSAELLGAGAVVTGDDALLLWSPVPDRSSGDLSDPYVVLSVRAADYVGAAADELDRIASEVDEYAAAHDLTVLGVSLNDQPGTEEVTTLLGLARAASPRAASWRLLDHDPDPRRVAALLAGAHAVVAQSFHAALLALAAGVPAVLGAASPYYVAKAEGLRAVTGLPGQLVLGPGEALDLAARVQAITEGLATGGVEAARTRVVQWWDGALADLLAVAGAAPLSG
jgi:polysaccharide pyruvyl transferase WcaK-like protein